MSETLSELTTGYATGLSERPDRAGRYALIHEIGRGGMGAVYRADDAELGRDLAVKVLLAPLADRPEAALRFVAEARLTARLQHPGIPPVHEMGALPDGRHFFAMKLVQGRTFADLLADSPGQPRAVAVFAQVCHALAYAHSRGIVHRDLKPDNVMVGEFGEVQVMDWGLALDLASRGRQPPEEEREEAPGSPLDDDRLTRAGAIMGTPAYMAPEQARGDAVDARADVFGLGGLLCVILTGKPPFGGGSAEAIRQAASGDTEEARSRLAACGADAELVGLARRCLAADPGERPADAGEVARAVDAYTAGVQDRLRRAEQDRARAEVKAAEERKRRRLALLLAGAVLALVAAGVYGAWAWREQHQREKARVARAEEVASALLDRAEASLRAGDLPAAASLLGQVEEASERKDEAEWALGLARRLDVLRRERLVLLEGGALTGAMPRLYSEALEGKIERAGRSPVRGAVLAVLDDWAVLEPDARKRAEVLAAARAIDPGMWQDRFRDPARRGDRAALEKLADEADLDALPAGSVAALAELLERAGGSPVPLLRRARERHPSDFWVCFTLGTVLSRLEPSRQQEAVAMFEAARTLRPDSEQVWNNIGQALLVGGSVKRAEEELSRVVAARPESVAAWGNLALARYHQGRLDEALAAAERSIGLMEKSSRREERSAYIFHTLGLIRQARGEPGEALSAFRRGAESGDRRPRVMANYARDLGFAGRRDESMAAWRRVRDFCTEAIRKNPRDAEAWVGRGRAMERVGTMQESLADLREAVRVAPSDANAWQNLANGLGAGKQTAEALAALDRAVSLMREQGCGDSPDLALLQSERRRRLSDLGRLPEALEAMREAVRLLPGRVSYRDGLVRTLNDLGDSAAQKKAAEEGIALAEKILARNPGHHATMRDLASLLRFAGRASESTAILRRMLAADPRDTNTMERLAISLRIVGTKAALEEGYRLLVRACRIKPNDPHHHYELSITSRHLGMLADAVAAARESVRLGPERHNARIVLANALRVKGEADEAVVVLRRVLAEKPDYHYAWMALSDALLDKGLPVESLRAVREWTRLAPKDGRALLQLADIRFRIGDWPGMLVALQRAEKAGRLRDATLTALRNNAKVARARLASHDVLTLFSGSDRPEKAVAAYERMEAVLDGGEKVRNAGEAFILAQVARRVAYRRLGSVRLYEMAFEMAPGLIDLGNVRWQVVMAALLSTMGAVDMPEDPSDPIHNRMRRLALTRFSEDVDRIEEAIRLDGLTAELRKKLVLYRDDETIKQFMHPFNLGRLPPQDRKSWAALMKRVEKLLAPPPMRPAS